MKNVDYRKKLGLGFNDESKIKMLKIRIFNLLTEFDETKEDWELEIDIKKITRNFSDEIGILIPSEYKNLQIIYYIICSQKDISSCVYFFVTFLNTLKHEYNDYVIIETLETRFLSALDNMKISYDKSVDSDGIFIFPKGAEELDSALVSEPLEWLKDYPQTKKTYVIALKQYSDGIYIRDVADNLRKTLEAFFQEFLGNKKNLANNINEVFKFLGTHNAEPELAGSIKDLLSKYDSLNNKIAKHNDKVDARYLEFLLYQTGIFIRMLITVKNTDAKESLNAN